MSAPSPERPGLLRISVSSTTRRTDLQLPAGVPLAELLPELARSVGLMHSAAVHDGYRAVTTGGRVLVGDLGLAAQGIPDGGVLAVVAGVHPGPAPLYDDPVEAMGEVVDRDFEQWPPSSGRRATLAAAVLATTLGAVALTSQRGTALAPGSAAVMTSALLVVAVVLSRTGRELSLVLTVAGMGAGWAAVTGVVAMPVGGPVGAPVAAAGGGVLVAGLLCLFGLDRGSSLAFPAVAAGAAFLGAGVVSHLAHLDVAVPLTATLALVVTVSHLFPHVALRLTDPDFGQVDGDRLSADARVAHEILMAINAAMGALLVLTAPFAVSRGPAGALLVLAACTVVLLRTRQHRLRAQVLIGVVSGTLGLTSLTVSSLVMQPGWRAVMATVLVTLGSVLVTCCLLGSAPSARRKRLGDTVEGTCLVVLPSLLLLAAGLLPALAG